MDKVQKHNSFNTNTPSSESYKNYKRILSAPSHSVTLISILILSSHLHLCLPSSLASSCFLTKILHVFLVYPRTCVLTDFMKIVGD
jgi:hypothetical protein